MQNFIETIKTTEFINTLFLTFKLAFFTTFVLIIIGLPLAYLISYKKFPFKTIFETAITLPIVLPPSVIGFYYIVFFSPNNFLGKFIEDFLGLRLVFTFEGIVLASVIYCLPFMVQPLQNGFKSIPTEIIEASYTLGKSKLTTFFKVILPNMKNAILTAMILTFAHTIGEFGIVLIVGGAIPNETLVASISIYNEMQDLNYDKANTYALILLLISFITLFVVNLLNRKFEGK